MRLSLLLLILGGSALGCVSAPGRLSARSAASTEAPESPVDDRPRELGAQATPLTAPPPEAPHAH